MANELCVEIEIFLRELKFLLSTSVENKFVGSLAYLIVIFSSVSLQSYSTDLSREIMP